MLPYFTTNQGKELEKRVSAIEQSSQSGQSGSASTQSVRNSSPLKKVSVQAELEDDNLFVFFPVDDVDVFCSIMLESESKGWKICLTHGSLVANNSITTLYGFKTQDDGNVIQVLSVPNGDFYLNEPSPECIFNQSAFDVFDVEIEEGDVITMTYYHTDCPCRIYE